ncbi:hypothetical protein PRIC1_004189 [Phytophthora ramorum]
MADKGIKGSLRHQLFMHQYLHEVSERKKTGEEFSAMKPQTHAEFHEVAEQHTEVGKAVKARCGGDLSEDGSDDGNDDIKVIKDKYAAYTKRTDGMEKTRNKILANSGRVELDAEPYDHLKTTKAAVRKLKGTRKAARVLYSRTASMDSRVESNSSSEATEGDRDSE